MESSEQTGLPSKMERDLESRMTVMGELGGGGIKQNGKRTHGHRQHYGDFLVGGEGSKRGINCNGKNYNK